MTVVYKPLVFLSDAGLVPPPDFDLDTVIDPGAYLPQAFGEVFLNVASAASSRAQWRGRAERLAEPIRRSSRPTVVSASDTANCSRSHAARKHKGPGKANREGISLKKLMRMFPDDDRAREWFEARIWPQGSCCPRCGSFNVQCGIKHKTMTHRCRECEGKPRFSLKTGTVMEGSKLGYQTWAIALYLVMTGLKGVSSMKLHQDLEITQKSAWRLAHRLHKALEAGDAPLFLGPAEADETYIGGK